MNVGDDGTKMISKGLKHNSSLTELVLNSVEKDAMYTDMKYKDRQMERKNR